MIPDLNMTFMKQILRSTDKLKVLALLLSGLLGLHHPALSQEYIADHRVASEEVLRRIPKEYINKARNGLVVAFQHTSHGTHVSRSMYGLQDYKKGDKQLFGVSVNSEPGKLDFRSKAMVEYAPEGVDGRDLSKAGKGFVQTTRNYLDAPENASVNVVMWSWCNIYNHDVKREYLDGMAALIAEYGEGGSKVGTGQGQRKVPVTFIFMTGHAMKNFNVGPRRPRNQADEINAYCEANSQFCLDYYSIETHHPDGTYYEDANENGESDSYGGNFLQDWQDAHILGEDYFENRFSPGSRGIYGSHTTQHITANRKAYAMWWILARIAGWDGTLED
jgi:hypothetical protein